VSPFATTSAFGIPHAFDVRLVVGIQLVRMIYCLALPIESPAGTLRSPCADGIAGITRLLNEIVFLDVHSEKNLQMHFTRRAATASKGDELIVHRGEARVNCHLAGNAGSEAPLNGLKVIRAGAAAMPGYHVE
jgi:hypothetical protein